MDDAAHLPCVQTLRAGLEHNANVEDDDDDDDDEEDEEDVEMEVVVDVDTGVTTKKKKVGVRGPKWKPMEDECLIDSWKAVSMDPVTGANQTADKYYKRIFDQFNERKRFGDYATMVMERNESAMSHRWAAIKKGCNKFHGFLETMIRRAESGKTMVDYVSSVLEYMCNFGAGHLALIHVFCRCSTPSPCTRPTTRTRTSA